MAMSTYNLVGSLSRIFITLLGKIGYAYQIYIMSNTEMDRVISSFFLVFTTSLIWFGDQFWHEVVPASFRSQLRGIES
jgi:hypothetical protein